MADHYMSSFLQGYGEVYFLNLNEVQNHIATAGQYAIIHSESYSLPTCATKCKFKSGQCPTCPLKHFRHESDKRRGTTYPPDGSRIFEIALAENYPVLATSSILWQNTWRDISKVIRYDPVVDTQDRHKKRSTLVPTVQLGLEFYEEEARSLVDTPFAYAGTTQRDFLSQAVQSRHGIKAGCTVTFGFAIDRQQTFDKSGYSQLAPSELHRRYGFQFCQIQLAMPTVDNPHHRQVVIGVRSFPYATLELALRQELTEPKIARYACNIDRSIRHKYILPATYNYADPQRFVSDKSLSDLAPKRVPCAIRQGFAIQEDATATRGVKEKYILFMAKNNPPSIKHYIPSTQWQKIAFPKSLQEIGFSDAPLHLPDEHQEWNADIFEEWLSQKDARSLEAHLKSLLSFLSSKTRINEDTPQESESDEDSREFLQVEETSPALPPTTLLRSKATAARITALAYIQARLSSQISSHKYRTSTDWTYIPSTRHHRDDIKAKWNKPLPRSKHPGKEFVTTPLKNNKRKIALFREVEEKDEEEEWEGEKEMSCSPCRKGIERLDIQCDETSSLDLKEFLAASYPVAEEEEEEEETDIEDVNTPELIDDLSTSSSEADASSSSEDEDGDEEEEDATEEAERDSEVVPQIVEDFADAVSGNKENIVPATPQRVFSHPTLLVYGHTYL